MAKSEKEKKELEKITKPSKTKSTTKKVEKKPAKKKETKKVKKTGYFKSLKSELSKVKWPSLKEVMKYTMATVILCVLLGGFFQLMDLLTSLVKGWFN